MTYVNKTEMARRLGVTPQRVTNWVARYPDFPSPAENVVGVSVWEWSAVDKWAGTRAADNLRNLQRVVKGGTE